MYALFGRFERESGDGMRDTALILTQVKFNALGQREQVTFQWVGESPYTYITGVALDDLGIKDEDKSFWIGPYRLVKLERYVDRDEWLCIRSDWQYAWRVPIYRSTRWLDWAYRRLIVVLAVFELADYHQYAIPSWRDIHALKRWARPKVVK